jgi:hypothetical protein
MAICTSVKSVQFVSTNPEVDPLIEWLNDLKFWDGRVRHQVEKEGFILSTDLIKAFQKKFDLPFNYDTCELLKKILSSPNGVWLRSLGYYDDGWFDPKCCVGRILTLRLAHIPDHVIIKPSKIARDPRMPLILGVPYIRAYS